ncbi:MAG TPA: zinc ABC transporter substrate-binding protein [Protaetiibacter sp.]|nr:zinc ABC transporter substrate-binding protein [Protaetiibacter sp.]
MRSRAPHTLPLALAAATALALTGCAGDGADGAPTARLQIVASTNVYGDIAATVAGDAAEVTSIISDTALDPHEYEATPRDALAIAQADLVIVNGGGYDVFMGTLLEAHENDAVVLDAVALSGLEEHEGDAGHDHDEDHGHDDDHDEDNHDDHDHDHGSFNEHVWYQLDAMARLAETIAAELSRLDPASSDTFERNARDFAAGIEELTERAATLAEQHEGTEVAITEPVPLYLLAELRLHNVTPAEFSNAVEAGTDAPALVVRDVVALVSEGSVALLAYNAQTAGSQTEEVLAAARAAGTPVVSFSELLPEGEDYLGWMRGNLDALAEALG